MLKWKDITLYKFQQVQTIAENKELSEEDRGLFAACVLFDYTEYEFDHLPIRTVSKCLKQVEELFKTEFHPEPVSEIGEYQVNYYPETMTFGQYIELAYYLSKNPIMNAHHILASITNLPDLPNSSDEHEVKAELFLLQPISFVLGTIRKFQEKYKTFNDRYKDLFGLDGDNAAEVSESRFFKTFGWIYSATRVAEHERITLDQAMNLPVRNALTDLRYLKEKDKFDEQQIKRK